jgi:23S rRNA pseudouridine1911/1915/1917 synthase
MIVEEIPAALGGERLDRIVALLAGVSRSEAVRLIGEGFVLVDGTPDHAGKERLREGQVVEIDPAGISVPALPLLDHNVVFDVVFEDEHLLVIDKPAGLVVHPATGNESGTLVNGLLARYPELADVGDPARPGIVHRLDGGTSGLMIVARVQAAYLALVEALRNHDIERIYDALVWGAPESPTGLIDAPIGRDPRDPLKMAIVATGRVARTRYHVDTTFSGPDLARLTCELETGRTHQIRVHLAAVGHPVVADVQYGARRPTFGLTRPFLHARRLAFVHPITGDTLDFVSELPKDLADVLSTLA